MARRNKPMMFTLKLPDLPPEARQAYGEMVTTMLDEVEMALIEICERHPACPACFAEHLVDYLQQRIEKGTIDHIGRTQ